MKHPPRLPFSNEMTMAWREGKKRRTRRVVREHPVSACYDVPVHIGGRMWALHNQDGDLTTDQPGVLLLTAPWEVGDELVLAENVYNSNGVARYSTGGQPIKDNGPVLWRWKVQVLPARYMPVELARSRVTVESLALERLDDITEASVIEEGVRDVPMFLALWDRLNADRGAGVDENPWVWNLGISGP